MSRIPATRLSWRRFSLQSSGVAAVEFALILPLMLLLYLGVFDISKAVRTSRKAAITGQTIGNLVSAQATGTPLPASTIADLFTAMPLTMAPYAPSLLTVTVSAIDVRVRTDGTCCDATVNWSVTQGGTLRPCGIPLQQTPQGAAPSPATIPAALASASSWPQTSAPASAVIITDVTYTFTPLSPMIDRLFPTQVSQSNYAFPRQAGQVLLQNPAIMSAGQAGVVCP